MSRSETPKSDQLISRSELARRWSTSINTDKRREREGILKRIAFNPRLIRYRLSDVEGVELAAMSH